jgi:hypothetical protein
MECLLKGGAPCPITPEEEQKDVEILERYLPELESETVHTDNRELPSFSWNVRPSCRSCYGA